jgi:hypothetical protein
MSHDREGVVNYICDLHNKVNNHLGKPKFECSKAFDFWGGGCGCNEFDTNNTSQVALPLSTDAIPTTDAQPAAAPHPTTEVKVEARCDGNTQQPIATQNNSNSNNASVESSVTVKDGGKTNEVVNPIVVNVEDKIIAITRVTKK